MADIQGYKIVREIGRGGMSTVYLAIQKSVNRYVALKVMSSSLVHDDTYIKRFLREARIAARFRHPNIISILDVNVSKGVPYIAMEYVPGGDLNTERVKSMSLIEKLAMIVQIADALGFLHNQQFVHRDIKPGNILFREDGTAVLTDFGIAADQSADAQMTLTGYIIGTPHYLSPEQARGDKVDARSDIYSLGVMLFMVLAGRLPFVAEDAISVCSMHIEADIPDLPEKHEKFDPVVKKAMSKTPEERFQSANAFIDALIAVTGSDTARLLRRSAEGVALEAIRDEDRETTTKVAVDLSELEDATRVRTPMVKPRGRRKRSPLPDASWLRRLRSRSWGWVSRALDRGEDRQSPGPQSLVARLRQSVFDHRWLLVAGTGIAVVVAIGFTLLLRTDFQDEAAERPEVVEERAAPSSDVAAGLPPTPSLTEDAPPGDDYEISVDELLVLGHKAMAQGALFSPEGSSALARFRTVLEREPGNEYASRGLNQLASTVLGEIDRLLEAGDFDQAGYLLGDLRSAGIADATELQAREQRLQRLIGRTQERDSEIRRLLDGADTLISQNQLTQPAGANAVDELNKVLAIDPGNAEALAGLRRVGERYLELARGELAAGDLGQAEAYWAKAGEFGPDLTGADEVRERLDELKQTRLAEQPVQPRGTQETRPSQSMPPRDIRPYSLPQQSVSPNESLDSVINRAEQAWQAHDEMAAYALYKYVWRRDPNNALAARRLQSGARGYILTAERDISKRDLSSAYRNLSIALALDAEHPKLDSARRSYLAAMDNMANQSLAGQQSVTLTSIRIQSLLEEAEFNHSRFRNDNSDRTAAENARSSYVSVLEMNRNDGEAREGLKVLQQDLIAACRRAIDEAQPSQALWLLETARKINPNNPELSVLESRID